MEKGYFKEAGVDVDFETAARRGSSSDLVINGKAPFAICFPWLEIGKRNEGIACRCSGVRTQYIRNYLS